MQLHLLTQSIKLLLILILLNVSFSFNSNAFSTVKDSTQPLRIAVATNFTPALKKLLDEFHQQTNINTQIISGATGALFVQIQQGAPFDIFISADSIRPTKLEQQHLTLAGSRKIYALGQLSLFSMKTKAKLSDLTQYSPNSLQRFAIANPNIAPYGKAAKQALQYLGLWEQYQPKLIQGVNVNQTFTQIRSQAVNSGLVANSLLVLNNLTGVVIPSSYHQPIVQQLVIIKSSANIDKAKRLSEYLLSTDVQQKISQYGYVTINQGTINQDTINQDNMRTAANES